MGKLLGAKISGGVDYMDLFGAGLVKYAAERGLAPIVGNGSFKSGAVKIVGGVLARKFMGRGLLGDSVSLGLSIDGVEDVLTALIGTGLGGIGGGSSEGAW